MDNPYRTPATPVIDSVDVESTPSMVRLLRSAVICAAVVYSLSLLIGFVGGISMAFWEIYGSTYEEAIENSRLVRRMLYGLTGAIAYWWFSSRLPCRRWLLVVLALLSYVAIDLLVSLAVFRDSLTDWFDPWSLGRVALAALVGLLASWLTPRPQARIG